MYFPSIRYSFLSCKSLLLAKPAWRMPHFSTFYHRGCTGLYICFYPHVLSNSLLCWTQQGIFHTGEPFYLRHILSHDCFFCCMEFCSHSALQCLHVTSLCDSMWVFSFLPPMQVFSHLSHVRTRSSCFDSICTLRCFFQKELQSYKWHKKACWLQICSANKVVDFRYDDFSVTKTNKTEKEWQ